MALVEIMPISEIENNDNPISTTFLTNTLRSLFFSPVSSAGRECEIDKKLKQISLDEVSDHDAYDDCWIIIYDRVYDVTKFLQQVSSLLNFKPTYYYER